MATPVNQQSRLHRSHQDRMLFGVCGGLGEYFNLDPVIIRLGFVLLTLAGGAGLLVYLILAVVLPEQDAADVAGQAALRRNLESLRTEAGDMARGFGSAGTVNGQRSQNLAGLILVALGLFALFSSLGWLRWIHWGSLWPLLLIGLGLFVLLRRNQTP